MAAIPLSEPVRPDPDPQNSVIEAGPARYGVTGSLWHSGLATAHPARATKNPRPLELNPRSGVFHMVREGGVEPPRPHGHTDLNRARLPIPPLALRH